MGPNLWSDPENSGIAIDARSPDDWADDLAAGRMTAAQLKANAEAFAAERASLPDRVRITSKLAGNAELDHRAGQAASAVARATVALALAAALEATQESAGGGFLGKLLGSQARLTDALLAASSQAHLALGGVARDRGDLGAAEREYRAALEDARRMQKGELATGVAMMELGHTAQLQGSQTEAEQLLRDAHPLLVKAQGPSYVPLDVYLLGVVQGSRQLYDQALATLQEAESGYERHGLSRGVLDAQLARTDVLIHTGRLDDAEQLASNALESAKQQNEPQYMAQALWHLSRIKRQAHQPDAAEHLVRDAARLYSQAGDSWHEAQSYMVLSEIAIQAGQLDNAARDLDNAERIAKAINSPYLMADSTHSRAVLQTAAGKTAEARRLYDAAISMFGEQGRQDQVKEARAELERLANTSR